jgi:DUF917 family protein
MAAEPRHRQDGDGMGRAFPEVQMTTFFIYGQDPSPAAIADDKGNVVVFNKVVDMFWLERFARHIAVDMGAGAGFATSAMRGGFVKKVAVPGTVSQALGMAAHCSTRAPGGATSSTGSSARPARPCCSPARSPMSGAR